jgi:hypothetical protein
MRVSGLRAQEAPYLQCEEGCAIVQLVETLMGWHHTT